MSLLRQLSHSIYTTSLYHKHLHGLLGKKMLHWSFDYFTHEGQGVSNNWQLDCLFHNYSRLTTPRDCPFVMGIHRWPSFFTSWCHEEWPSWPWPVRPLKIESCYDDCHDDNLHYHQWRQSWHHTNSRFSMARMRNMFSFVFLNEVCAIYYIKSTWNNNVIMKGIRCQSIILKWCWNSYHLKLILTAIHVAASSLKRNCHIDEIFVIYCAGNCRFDNFRCRHWRKFRQNNISVSVHSHQSLINWIPFIDFSKLKKFITMTP